jgi:hypothetical protein
VLLFFTTSPRIDDFDFDVPTLKELVREHYTRTLMSDAYSDFMTTRFFADLTKSFPGFDVDARMTLQNCEGFDPEPSIREMATGFFTAMAMRAGRTDLDRIVETYTRALSALANEDSGVDLKHGSSSLEWIATRIAS